MKPAIRVDNLSKQYRLTAGPSPLYRTLAETVSDALAGLARRVTGSAARPAVAPAEPEFWALDRVSFEVEPGEVVGIIGRNGAGKSTLLKVLSRIVEPTAGRAELRGRVGSLLEVGTGFHPELSGRENVYLNGSILGMTRREIDRKFDEIVAFAEVERFLDLPVKRYSSGMYVRLAFAVAAHLEPEILIVDEVLAVGDVQFQEKCLGKMREVGRGGRTVLFVSHNAQAISQLTTRCLLLESGRCAFDGPTPEALALYNRRGGRRAVYEAPPEPAAGNRLRRIVARTSDPGGLHRWGHPIAFEFDLEVTEPAEGLCFSFQVVNQAYDPVCHFWLFEPGRPYTRRAGLYRLRCEVPKLRLYMGRYTLTTWLSDRSTGRVVENLSAVCEFEVSMDWAPRERYDWKPGDCVYVEEFGWDVAEAE